jgi:hypothetical protein
MTDTEAAKADDELVERLKDGAFCFGSEVCDTNPQNCPCSQRKKAAAAITRLRAELAEEHARFDKWHTKAAEEHALRLAAEAERDSAVQRADLLTKELADVRLSEENDALIDALAAERAARERMRGLLRDCRCPRPANTAPDYTTVGECLSRLECGCTYGSALSAPAEASAGEAAVQDIVGGMPFGNDLGSRLNRDDLDMLRRWGENIAAESRKRELESRRQLFRAQPDRRRKRMAIHDKTEG